MPLIPNDVLFLFGHCYHDLDCHDIFRIIVLRQRRLMSTSFGVQYNVLRTRYYIVQVGGLLPVESIRLYSSTVALALSSGCFRFDTPTI